ncbi:fungal-specific transcription factor domain-containing protein [Zopfochytrium polystomum]|nr:fungal-specific transcription factor domain-containing protein [Zopfochytrium polystomum]
MNHPNAALAVPYHALHQPQQQSRKQQQQQQHFNHPPLSANFLSQRLFAPQGAPSPSSSSSSPGLLVPVAECATAVANDRPAPHDGLRPRVDPDWRVTPETLHEMLVKASLQENILRPSYYPDIDRPSPSAASTWLPDRPGADPCEQELLVDAYFDRDTLIQVIHKKTYLENRKQLPSYLQAAVCAAGASVQALMTLPKQVLLYYYEFARSRALDACDLPTIENLQALLILADISFVLGKMPVGRMLFGFACRVALFLEVHIDPDEKTPKLTPVEKETRRRCWWTCFLTDRFVSTAYLRLPTLSDEALQVKPMCSEDLWFSMEEDAANKLEPLPTNNHASFFARLLEIAIDVIKICSEFRPGNLTLEDLQQMIVFEDQLEQWARDHPPDFWTDPDQAFSWLPTQSKGGFCSAAGQWAISNYLMYHATHINLAAHLLHLVLPPLVVRADNEGFGGGGQTMTMATLLDREVAAAKQALAKGVTAAHSIARLATHLTRLNIFRPVFGMFSVFAAAQFLALADAATARLAPLCIFSPPSQDALRALAQLVAFFEKGSDAVACFGVAYAQFKGIVENDWSLLDAAVASVAPTPKPGPAATTTTTAAAAAVKASYAAVFDHLRTRRRNAAADPAPTAPAPPNSRRLPNHFRPPPPPPIPPQQVQQQQPSSTTQSPAGQTPPDNICFAPICSLLRLARAAPSPPLPPPPLPLPPVSSSSSSSLPLSHQDAAEFLLLPPAQGYAALAAAEGAAKTAAVVPVLEGLARGGLGSAQQAAVFPARQ